MFITICIEKQCTRSLREYENLYLQQLFKICCTNNLLSKVKTIARVRYHYILIPISKFAFDGLLSILYYIDIKNSLFKFGLGGDSK